MSEVFQPPAGPPPPALPEGWKAQWSEQYNTFFYVNLNSKRSQWEPPEGAAPPPGAPPGWYNTDRSFGADEESLYCDGNGTPDHPAACGAKEKHKPHKFRRAVSKLFGKFKK